MCPQTNYGTKQLKRTRSLSFQHDSANDNNRKKQKGSSASVGQQCDKEEPAPTLEPLAPASGQQQPKGGNASSSAPAMFLISKCEV